METLELDDAIQQARELMEDSDAVFLTTVDSDGFPVTRAMLNLRNTLLYPTLVPIFEDHQEDFVVYFTTNTSSAKIQQLVAQPRASVYFCLPQDWRGLCMRGSVEQITDPEMKAKLWQGDWDLYYPRGVADPDYSVLKFTPATANYYHQQQVYKWEWKSEQA